MTVYTYYESLEPGDPNAQACPANPVLELFRQSWADNGWTTRVLGRCDAALHPNYVDYFRSITEPPTVNQRQFETACYLRYLAMLGTSHEGGLLVDMDVINYSFTPDMLPDLPEFTLQRGSGTFGSQYFYGWLCYELAHWKRSRVAPWLINGSEHWSDMVFLSSCLPSVDLCITRNQGPWKTSPLVHYSNGSLFLPGEIPTAVERAKRIIAARPLAFL